MDNRVEIAKGLTEGERVVVSGTFLIDSESRLQGLASSFQGAREVDPVCGTQVATGPGTLKTMLNGKTYYFCASLCKDKFDRDPGQYLDQRRDNPGIQQVSLNLK